MKKIFLSILVFFVFLAVSSSAFAVTALKKRGGEEGVSTSTPVVSTLRSGQGEQVKPGTEKMSAGNLAWVMQWIYSVCLEKGWREWTLSEESGQNLVKVFIQDDEDGNEYTLIGCMAKGILRVCLLMTDNDLNKDAQVFCDSLQKNPDTGQFEWVRVNSIVPHRAEEPDE